METGNTGFVVKASPSFVARGSINICRMNEWDYLDCALQAYCAGCYLLYGICNIYLAPNNSKFWDARVPKDFR